MLGFVECVCLFVVSCWDGPIGLICVLSFGSYLIVTLFSVCCVMWVLYLVVCYACKLGVVNGVYFGLCVWWLSWWFSVDDAGWCIWLLLGC